MLKWEGWFQTIRFDQEQNKHTYTNGKFTLNRKQVIKMTI